MPISLPEGYNLETGSGKDRALLLRFLNLTYRELFPQQHSFSHLATTVEQYFSRETPLWWVKQSSELTPVACLWLGNAIDQVVGDRYTHIFLIYVKPEHRCRGIATALLQQAQNWSQTRGDRQMSLQVFCHNQAAVNLYTNFGFQTQSLFMVKSFHN
jgi:ribosomal protein S18 acetylase RimI-like enzyme